MAFTLSVATGRGSQKRRADAKLGEPPGGAAADEDVRGPAADAIVLPGARPHQRKLALVVVFFFFFLLFSYRSTRRERERYGVL